MYVFNLRCLVLPRSRTPGFDVKEFTDYVAPDDKGARGLDGGLSSTLLCPFRGICEMVKYVAFLPSVPGSSPGVQGVRLIQTT